MMVSRKRDKYILPELLWDSGLIDEYTHYL